MAEATRQSAESSKKATAQRDADNDFTLEVKDNGIAFLELDFKDGKVNILSSNVMRELDEMLDHLHERKDITALVIVSGKPDNFIAGADVNEIKDVTTAEDGAEKARMGQAIFRKLHELPYPVIAAIQGACVGGGLELALACHFRIAKVHPKTRIGLPEVKLGILPGFGGTQRLPRLIGIQRALRLILTGKLVDAKTAGKLGIVDKVLPVDHHGFMKAAAEEFAETVLGKFKRHAYENKRNVKRLHAIFLESNSIGRNLIFRQSEKMVMKNTKGYYPAPLKALESVKRGIGKPLEEALEIEAQLLGELIVTDVCKNLISIFFMTEDLKKDRGVEKAKSEPLDIKQVGMLGAGVMGGGIAQLLAYNEIPVRMKDINQEAIEQGMGRAKKVFEQAVDRNKLSNREMDRRMTLISATTEYDGFENSDMIIEAIVENLELKQKVFAEIEQYVSEKTILATNTSSLSITGIASSVKKPERVLGFHFFNPVHRMPLVEIIRGDKTSDEATITAVAFAKKISKTPIVVKNSPGFLVNRILGPYINEGALLLEDGALIDEIDKAMVEFGMPMGPLNLLDEVGIDVGFKVASILHEAFPERMAPSAVIEKMHQDKRLGKKGKKGFYLYDGKSKQVDPEVYKLINHEDQSSKFSREDIQNRLVFIMLKEAVLCLQEKIVRRPRDVDAGLIFGTGFPPFRGGLLRYADNLGAQVCVDKMKELTKQCGERFQPPKLLLEKAEKGGSFYDEH